MSAPSPAKGVMVLTDRTAAPGEDLVPVVAAAVDAGARLVVLREKDLPHDRRARLADRLRPIVHDVGGLLIVASDAGIAADGLHLAAADPMPTDRARFALVGRSCHRLDEVLAAAQEGADYVTVSPVFASSSKPGYGPALGLAELARWCAASPVPVFALGGVDAGNAAACLDAGAAGVAVMGAVMGAADPAGETSRLVVACRRPIDPGVRTSARVPHLGVPAAHAGWRR